MADPTMHDVLNQLATQRDQLATMHATRCSGKGRNCPATASAGSGGMLYGIPARRARRAASGEEMALFLARTAGLGNNPPVVRAKTAQTAANADTLGGYAPSGLVRVARNGLKTSFQVTSPCATYVPLIELTITAPVAGFLLVNGAAGATLADTGVTALFMRPRVGNDIGPQAVIYPNDTTVLVSTAAVSWVFPVEAGA